MFEIGASSVQWGMNRFFSSSIFNALHDWTVSPLMSSMEECVCILFSVDPQWLQDNCGMYSEGENTLGSYVCTTHRSGFFMGERNCIISIHSMMQSQYLEIRPSMYEQRQWPDELPKQARFSSLFDMGRPLSFYQQGHHGSILWSLHSCKEHSVKGALASGWALCSLIGTQVCPLWSIRVHCARSFVLPQQVLPPRALPRGKVNLLLAQSAV